jgi:lantibiotic biosynthesis protein
MEIVKKNTKAGPKSEALEKIQAINEVLFTNSAYHHGFLGGTLGLLYYYFNAYKVLQSNMLLQKAEALLEQVFEDVNETGKGIIGASLSNGAAGFAFAVNYLQKEGFIDFEAESELVDWSQHVSSSYALSGQGFSFYKSN